MADGKFRKGSTCIFSYHEKEKELTLTEAILNQTFPLSRTTPIVKNTFTIGKDRDNDIVLYDEYVSNYHCKIEFRNGSFFIKDLQSTNGTFINRHKVMEAALPDGAVIEIGKAKFTFQVNQSTQTIQPLENENYFCGMISNHPSMKEVFGLIRSLEQSTTPVLIQGETGTGKELVARAIHENSPRRSQRFISVNCGAIAKELIESELFGHEKGAFTGAAFQREGLFELANGGTLFLDEIGELPIELQPKLLRVLESGEIRRVGSSKNIHVNVRIVTATHRNLSLEVREKRFREDLYYRIYVLPVTLPALRQRLSDIDLLTRHFLKDLKSIHPKALEKLHMHSWPGNIRELKNVIERAVILSGHGDIGENHIHFASMAFHEEKPFQQVTLEEIEKIAIIEALEKNQWKKTETAQKLGIAKSTLHEKVKKYGIAQKEFSA
jgi:DNA-binding NtrC family response regulator